MPLFLKSKKNLCLKILFLCFFQTSLVYALDNPLSTQKTNKIDTFDLEKAEGLIKLDYQVIPIPGYQPIDFFGIHYLHQIYDSLYFGISGYVPLFYGNYGGFAAFGTTIQYQKRLFGHFFGVIGGSFGGGAGGSSVASEQKMTGEGEFIDAFSGLGYQLPYLSFGVNYSYLKFFGSPINHAQINFYIQKSLSFLAEPYQYIGKIFESSLYEDKKENSKNIFTIELNNFIQENAKAQYKGSINTIALQLSRYISSNYFVLLDAEAGYRKLATTNFIFIGGGYRFPLSDHLISFTQLGLGSGGYDPNDIDTGPGFVIYPKIGLDYILTKNKSLSLTGGYLFPGKGSFRAYSVGLGFNYGFDDTFSGDNLTVNHTLKGFRASLYSQTEFDVRYNSKSVDLQIPNINLLTFSIDSFVHDYWYIPFQMGWAYSKMYKYTGYGELLTGIGLQTKYTTTSKFQYFFQPMIGANVQGLIFKPELGVNYGISKYFAIYGMLAKTISLSFKSNSYSAGLGLTYRFSYV